MNSAVFSFQLATAAIVRPRSRNWARSDASHYLHTRSILRVTPDLVDFGSNDCAGSLAEGRKLEQGYRVATGALRLKHLLRGRLDLMEALYWRMRSASRRGDRVGTLDYAAGALAHLRSAA